MQTGQNSIAPENSLPQLGQVRWSSVLMGLTALQPHSELKATPRSTQWCEIVQRHALANVGPASIASICISRGYQIRARIKIIDFAVQEYASLAASRVISFSETTDFERIAAKLHQIPGMRDLRFSKTILEMIFSK
jgi:hypothetical protein